MSAGLLVRCYLSPPWRLWAILAALAGRWRAIPAHMAILNLSYFWNNDSLRCYEVFVEAGKVKVLL